MKKIYLSILSLLFLLLLVGCGSQTTTRETNSTTTKTTETSTTTKVTTTLSDEDKTLKLYKNMLGGLVQYSGQTFSSTQHIIASVKSNETKDVPLPFDFEGDLNIGIDLTKESEIKVSFKLSGDMSGTGHDELNKALDIHGVVSLKNNIVGQKTTYVDDLYLHFDHNSRLLTLFILSAYTAYRKGYAFSSDDFFKADYSALVDTDYHLDLTSFMSTVIMNSSETSSTTIRTLINMIFSSDTIGTAVYNTISYLSQLNLIDNNYLPQKEPVINLLSSLVYTIYQRLIASASSSTTEMSEYKKNITNLVTILYDLLHDNSKVVSPSSDEEGSSTFGKVMDEVNLLKEENGTSTLEKVFIELKALQIPLSEEASAFSLFTTKGELNFTTNKKNFLIKSYLSSETKTTTVNGTLIESLKMNGSYALETFSLDIPLSFTEATGKTLIQQIAGLA